MIMFGVFGQTMAIFCGENARGRADGSACAMESAWQFCIPVSGL